MVQGDISTGVSTVTPVNSNKSTNPTRLFDENMNGIDNGEKKKKVGNYIISKTIGEGSFAKVRLGFHLITQQKVAVKVINKREVLKRNYLRANLRREACMMQRMQHPNIIQLFEVMETENCYYIVMELIDGIEFVKYLSKKRSLDENETRQYIRQIVSAVDHMHRAKVIHRDIKLQNFMLDQNFNLIIIDFGLSNCLDERDFLNTQCGSPAYAAPEIFAHQDYRSEVDIWSIGVNMYAMLAGKLPFKVENRSKNLAKLHACILKGCEIPSYLSPDCQDLLKRLLEPSPNLRIKMHEIIAHPWLNYHCFPIEIVPYKPFVDIKEIKTNIVQYLIQRHELPESEIVDAIVHRKPISIKAMYYLLEKRLKQGLNFPDIDFNYDENDVNLELSQSKRINNLQSNNMNLNHNAVVAINSNSNAISKHNSQLLPKRNNNIVNRTASQKNVDFKFIYNNLNNNTNKVSATENEMPNTITNSGSGVGRSESAMSSKSPSPDFTLAINPARNITTSSSTNTNGANQASITQNQKNSYHDIVYRKNNNSTSNISSNLYHNTNINHSNIPNGQSLQNIDRTIATASSNLSRNESRNDRYFMPLNVNNAVAPSDEIVFTSANGSKVPVMSNNSNVGKYNSYNPTNGIRSLPGSIYRGSPERSLPRSPDYSANQMQNLNLNNNSHPNRPTTSRIGSSKPSIVSENSNSEKYYDAQKFKVPNYYISKRSLTSCDESGFESRNRSSNILKSRQLPMGKAKIDLGTQQNLNVGVTVKNIGAYLKSPNRNSPEAFKAMNSNQKVITQNVLDTTKFSKQTITANQRQASLNSNNSSRLQGSDSANSLPRIRLSS